MSAVIVPLRIPTVTELVKFSAGPASSVPVNWLPLPGMTKKPSRASMPKERSTTAVPLAVRSRAEGAVNVIGRPGIPSWKGISVAASV